MYNQSLNNLQQSWLTRCQDLVLLHLVFYCSRKHSSLLSSHLPISFMESIFSGYKASKTCSAPGDSLLQLTNNFQKSIFWTWQFGGFICLSVQSVLLKCPGCGWNFCLVPHSVQGSGTQETHYHVCIGMWGKNPSPSLSHRCRRTSKNRQIVGLVSSYPGVKFGSSYPAMILAGSSIPLEAWRIKRYSKVLFWLLSSHALLQRFAQKFDSQSQ